MSTTLSLNYVLPLLNVSAGEYSPFHTHLIFGGTAADRAWLLAHHAHGQPPADPVGLALNQATTATQSARGVTLTSTGSSLLDLLSLAGGLVLLGAFDWPHAQVPLALWLLLVPASLVLLSLISPPPDRPPRPA